MLWYLFLPINITKMMTRSKTIATAVNAKVVEPVIEQEEPEEPEEPVEVANDDDSTIVYPSMFDRWKLSL